MLSISQICDQYAWLYTTMAAPPDAWDHIVPTDGAYAAIKIVDGTYYVMFRGSVTFLDWMEDFAAFAVPLETELLGGVHPGFFAGVVAVKTALDRLVGSRVVIVGHSLGAGHAAIYAALRVAAGLPVDALIMFGEPKAGCTKLAEILSNLRFSALSFCNTDANGHDLVTDVPLTLEPLLNYQHPFALKDVSASPAADDKWGPFRYHHFGLYCKALGATSPQALSLPV